jgi:hypothetical protein
MRATDRHKLLLGLYWGLVGNLAVAAILANNPWTAPSTHDWLVTLSAWNELYGILLIASPELLPRSTSSLRWVWTRLRRGYFAVEARVRRALGIPGRLQRIIGETGIAFSEGLGRGVARTDIAPDATLDEKVAFLLERVKQINTQLDAVGERVDQVDANLRHDLDDVRRSMTAEWREALRDVAEAQIELRLVGVTFVVAGLMLGWLGNLI